MKKMDLAISTVEKETFCGKVDRIELPGSLGRFQILLNHAPLVSTLVKGNVSYENSMGTHSLPITSGLVEVLNNKVRVLISIFSDGIDKK